jgi:3-deoxy-7-phosphoheptulonate synthase
VTVGDGQAIPGDRFEALDAVERIASLTAPYRFASREVFDAPRHVTVRPRSGGEAVEVGGTAPIVVMATPAASQHLLRWPEGAVAQIREAGASVLVTGAHPWSAGGERSSMSTELTDRIRAACDSVGLALCIEVDDLDAVAAAVGVADMLMVAPRNMQNFTLLRELGRCDLPVVLTRGAAATVEEFLLAAEYVLANGNARVILRESGASTQGSAGRPRFEVNLIPLLKQATHLPVIADPSRSTSAPHLIGPVAAAAIAAGADGLILELDEDPTPRSAETPMDPTAMRTLISDLTSVADAVHRRVVEPKPQVFRVQAGRSEPPSVTETEPVEEPEDVLRPTPLTLGVVIDSIIGEMPRLDVLRQNRISGPYPKWLELLLRPEGDLLVRWTSYMLGDITLTRNLAYVDLGRVDPDLVGKLETEELNLGEIFRSQAIDRFGYAFGTGADAGDIDVALRHGHPGNLHPYAWRRYIAATSGRVGFLVIESVPTLTWRRLLRSREPARSILKGVSR